MGWRSPSWRFSAAIAAIVRCCRCEPQFRQAPLVSIDAGVHSSARQPILNVEMTMPGIVGLFCATLAFGTLVLHGFDGTGVRLAGEVTWRLAAFVFFAAAVAGPVSRLLPLEGMRHLMALRRQLIWSFCVSYGVFLAMTLLPNTLGGVLHADLTAGMTVFSIFGGFIVAVLAYATGTDAAALVGEPARHALVKIAGAFFWLTYALTGLAHLSGPHRPDAFYGISLSLMIFALLLRFADRFVAKLRGTGVPVPSL